MFGNLFNLVTLAGIIIASRSVPQPWQLIIGVVLIVLGLVGAAA